MLRDVGLIANKDLRAELRSRVALNQIVPFALLILVLFGFALDADSTTLATFTPGLYWVAIVLSALLAVHRSVELEAGDGASDALLLSGVTPIAVFLGKALALLAELWLLAFFLLGGVLVLYQPPVADVPLLIATILVAVIGIAAAGTLYGALISGQRARETVLPILLLPVLAPVVIGASRAFADAMATVATNGWAWLALLGAFGGSYLVIGSYSYGLVLEDFS